MLSGPRCLYLRCPRIFTSTKSRTFSSRRIVQTSVRPRPSSFHSTGDLRPRNRIERNVKFSSSAPNFAQQDAKSDKLLSKTEESAQNNKRKTTRSQAAKNSLRRVAVEAQRSRDEKGLKTASAVSHQAIFKVEQVPMLLCHLILMICVLDRDSHLCRRRIQCR